MTPSLPEGPARYHDQRLPPLLARRGWRAALVLMLLAGVAAAFWHSQSLPATGSATQLSGQGLRCLAIFAAAVVLWVTEAVPLVATALGVFVALVCAGVESVAPFKAAWDVQTVSHWFGDKIVFFLLGIFLIAGALTATHVVDHLALRMLRVVGTGPRRLRQGVYWVTFFASFLMAEHAVAAMMFPLVARIRDALGRPRQSSSYVAGLFLGLAWGATIGGIVTYLGGARIALAMGIAQTKGVDTPGFFELMAYSLPIAIPFGIIAAIVLEIAFPVDIESVAPAREALEQRRRELGRFGPRQIMVSVVLLLTIAAWAVTGVKFLAPVALGAAAVFVATRLVTWNQINAHVPWDLLLMEGGAIALAMALERSGSATWAAHQLFSVLGTNELFIIAAITIGTIILTELFSNPAVVTLLVPLLIASAPQLGFAGREIALVLAVALPCGLSFVLPLGSPPLAIAFSSGEYRVLKVMIWGIVLDLLVIPLVLLAYQLTWIPMMTRLAAP